MDLQGDVIRLVNSSGATVASYEYNPYGKVISATGSMAAINPLRYRSYYYDSETGLYFLMSRYYDPAICRFINADDYASTGHGIIGHNMFAYCNNNPVMGYDPDGNWDWGVFTDILATAISAVVATVVGIRASTSTLVKTGSIKQSRAVGILSSTITLGLMNNTINSLYYNFISDGESNIETNPKQSSYTDGYVTRWERLDYTKQQTEEKYYNFDAWSFHSEYSVHMYGWYGTGWAYGKNVTLFSQLANKFYKADVLPHQLDSRTTGRVGTIIWGLLGF